MPKYPDIKALKRFAIRCAETFARCDHRHDDTYLSLNGGKMNSDEKVAGLNADMIDGKHNGELEAWKFYEISDKHLDCDNPKTPARSDYGKLGRVIENAPAGWEYGQLITFFRNMAISEQQSGLEAQFMWDVQHRSSDPGPGLLWFRTRVGSSSAIGSYKWRDWGRIAFVTDTVAAAERLATPRRLWGNSFDGTSDIDGTIYVHNPDLTTRYTRFAESGFTTFVPTTNHERNGVASGTRLQILSTGESAYCCGVLASGQTIKGYYYGGDWESSAMWIDHETRRIGVNTHTPRHDLDVRGVMACEALVIGDAVITVVDGRLVSNIPIEHMPDLTLPDAGDAATFGMRRDHMMHDDYDIFEGIEIVGDSAPAAPWPPAPAPAPAPEPEPPAPDAYPLGPDAENPPADD